MPRSRSKRSRYRPPPEAKPRRSPRWQPYLGLGLIGAGMLAIVAGYLVELVAGSWGLLAGFVLMAVGLVVLSRVH